MTKHDPRLLAKVCRETESLEGDLAEVGVWKGESALVILKHTEHGTLYLYDTFRGMPAEMTLPDEYHRPGTWGDTSLSLVTKTLQSYWDRVVLRPGVFPQTAMDRGPFRLVHIDVDQYLSTKAALEWFWPRLVAGGAIILDDYGCSTTKGARRAADEFVNANGCTMYRVGTRAVLSNQPALEVTLPGTELRRPNGLDPRGSDVASSTGHPSRSLLESD